MCVALTDYLHHVMESNPNVAETCTWLNVVVQRLYHSFAKLTTQTVNFEALINRKLASAKRPDFLVRRSPLAPRPTHTRRSIRQPRS